MTDERGCRCDGNGGGLALHGGAGGRGPTLGSRQQTAARSAGGRAPKGLSSRPLGGAVFCLAKSKEKLSTRVVCARGLEKD